MAIAMTAVLSPVRMTPETKALIERAAEINGQRVSDWARLALHLQAYKELLRWDLERTRLREARLAKVK